MSLCGNKIQVSSKKHLFHEIIEITMLKPKPYGPMALDDYAQSVALALQYVVQNRLGSPDSRGLFHTKIDCARQGPR